MIGLIKGLPRKVNMAGSPQPIVTFTSNVSGLYIPEILAYIQATQSGTGDPSPINPRTINGVSEVKTTRTGKNLANIFVDGKVPSISTGELVNAGGARTDFIKCLSSEKYTLSCSTSQVLYVFYYDENKGYLNCYSSTGTALTFTTPLNAKYLMLRFGSNVVNNGMLEKGSTPSTYQPYTGQTATTALGGTYYGGYLNVPTGLLTVTHRYYEFDGSNDENWLLHSINSYGIANFYIIIDDFSNMPGLCNRFSRQESTIATTTTEGYLMSPTSTLYIRIDSTRASDVATFRQWLTNNIVQFVYELATPQTYQLTPAQIEQLLGQNNVFCSSGDVAVTQIWARRDRSIISRG